MPGSDFDHDPSAQPAAADSLEARQRVTTALIQIDEESLDGDASPPDRPADALLSDVYGELRRLAASFLRRERSGHTLQATALVHEAYLKLADQDQVSWRGRSHFFAVGAYAMRRLLVDSARRKYSAKRGGDWYRVTLEESGSSLTGRPLSAEDLIALDEALDSLRQIDPRQAEVVELRFFGGLSMNDVARHLEVSKRTAEGDWAHARAWLRRALST
ncbi:MAG: sigma-70 family RNA polymerase sigma factor [Thermoanaerobaculia bacterium]|nr:sigma-70 family RNA polymerase sigma factor [Thermoanaerobaculia bacterium]